MSIDTHRSNESDRQSLTLIHRGRCGISLCRTKINGAWMKGLTLGLARTRLVNGFELVQNYEQ